MIIKRLLSSLAGVRRLPKLAVFDLDHTIWPFGVDTYCFRPPFHKNEKGQVIDMSSKVIEHFPDIPAVFQYLRDNNIQIGVASRTQYPSGAKALLEKLDLERNIAYFEIYPGQKTKHFERIASDSGLDYPEMIFFDDETRNIEDISAIGVFSVLVPHETGVTENIFHKALQAYQQQQQALRTRAANQ